MGYTTRQYLLARIPDLLTLLPGFDPDMACVSAKALYWDSMLPTVPPTDFSDDLLTERQKVMCGLRAALSTFLTAMKLAEAKVTMAKAGPAETKFEERFKTYKLLMESWQRELAALEAAEGIFFDLLPTVPAFLKNIETMTGWGMGDYAITDIQRGITVIEVGNG